MHTVNHQKLRKVLFFVFALPSAEFGWKLAIQESVVNELSLGKTMVSDMVIHCFVF
jgi:hypothetical protein